MSTVNLDTAVSELRPLDQGKCSTINHTHTEMKTFEKCLKEAGVRDDMFTRQFGPFLDKFLVRCLEGESRALADVLLTFANGDWLYGAQPLKVGDSEYPWSWGIAKEGEDPTWETYQAALKIHEGMTMLLLRLSKTHEGALDLWLNQPDVTGILRPAHVDMASINPNPP